MTKPLTTAAVQKYKPTGKRRLIRDGGARSLFLIIQPSGAKSWGMRFRRPGGKPGKLVLGPVDSSGREVSGEPVIGMPLTLVGARQLAAAVHRERAMGRDPVAEHKTRRHRQQAALVSAQAGTFGALLRRWVDEHARTKTRRWRRAANMLGLYFPLDGGEPTETAGGLAQRWADKPAVKIDGHDIWTVVDEARKHGIPGVVVRKPGASEARARDLYGALGSLFGWMHRNRLVTINPTAGVYRPPSAPSRDRALTPDEIRRFWLACDEISEPYGAVFRLLLLTGARLNEVAGMTRDELHADGVWHLPGSRTKNHRAHIVPLPPLALALIPQADGLIFSTTGRTPPSNWSRIKRSLDAEMGGPPPWHIHDLRRTVVTGMAELGIRPDVIEMVVNHVSGHRGGIAGVYNKAELLPERRAALLRWAQHVQGMVSGKPANVVAMGKRKGARS